ncbi:hypothetical protein FQN54_001918 [Arachnomyces sp. PD_36]|nr:hypothetical protein FQN54_001918 [Arachnomyces sp. PD_36]
MAKGLRSSVRKRNKTKLRATVYGPVVDARTERLSAKLQELASSSKPTESGGVDMQVDDADKIDNPNPNESKPKDQKTADDMDLDDEHTDAKPGVGEKKSTQPNRIQKKTRNKKRPSIALAHVEPALG